MMTKVIEHGRPGTLARIDGVAEGLQRMLLSYSDYGLEQAMTTSVLSVRVNDEERALLEAASEQARTSLSEFIRRKALDAAEAEILERRIVTIPAKDWEAFEAWANRPPREIPALKALAGKTPTWRK
jgi:uncharacterized protein (DUF1778 family)